MPPLAIASATVDAFQPDYTPVAVFIGGTSGVGEAMVNRLGNSLKGNIHIIIVGRNKSAAQATLASLPAPPGSTSPLREFVYCDASLMENIESASDDLKGVVARVGGKIHFLVNSAGYGSVIPVDTTKDGLDEQLVVRYYARWKFIDELLPLVRKARDAGEAARVMSILGGGRLFGTNSNIPAQDLSFEKSWWLVRPLKACFYSVVYNDLMIEELSSRDPGIAFTHIYPGMVNTSANERIYQHWLWTPVRPLLRVAVHYTFATAFQSSEWMLFGLIDGKDGFFSRTHKGDNVEASKDNTASRKALWEHTKVVTRSRTNYS